jgi:hypothetical protein
METAVPETASESEASNVILEQLWVGAVGKDVEGAGVAIDAIGFDEDLEVGECAVGSFEAIEEGKEGFVVEEEVGDGLGPGHGVAFDDQSVSVSVEIGDEGEHAEDVPLGIGVGGEVSIGLSGLRPTIDETVDVMDAVVGAVEVHLGLVELYPGICAASSGEDDVALLELVDAKIAGVLHDEAIGRSEGELLDAAKEVQVDEGGVAAVGDIADLVGAVAGEALELMVEVVFEVLGKSGVLSAHPV